METRVFKSKSGIELRIAHRKSAVIFEIDEEQAQGKRDFLFEFKEQEFKELITYLETISVASWGAIAPKEATSMGADYFEYYDKKLDNNGYLRIQHHALSIERPSYESNRLYQFTKRKMESFLYDCHKKIKQVS